MKKTTKYILALLVLITILIWAGIAQSPTADTLKNETSIHVLNVGQGDAILIEQGSNQILIDGGPDDSVLAELGKFMPLNDRNIETLILTHPHADHLAGLNQVIDRYQIGTIYYSGVSYDSNGYREFLAKIKDKNIQANIPETDTEIKPFENATLTFLYPGSKYSNITIDNANNSSEVAKFCYLSKCALFLGDLETDGQAEMFAASPDLNNYKSDLLKISHHGSVNGTNQATLANVMPKYAAISVGKDNKFGHPHAGTLDLLQKNNTPYFRTDQDGNINFTINDLGLFKR